MYRLLSITFHLYNITEFEIIVLELFGLYKYARRGSWNNFVSTVVPKTGSENKSDMGAN